MLNTIWHKFYATFILDNRYLIFADGLKVTLLLTFASFIFGTAAGVLLCAASRSRYEWLRKLARLITSLFTEIPTMMLLMIFAYIIFGRSALPLLFVVAIALTLKAGSYLSAIFSSALDTVEGGEIEAARTLGMTRWQAFKYVALPQTVVAALPLYRNQFIVTMQETSVVGYLALVDLTRAASIIQSRTLDAFFGLIAVTVIYFIIGAVVKFIFKQVSNRLGGEAA